MFGVCQNCDSVFGGQQKYPDIEQGVPLGIKQEKVRNELQFSTNSDHVKCMTICSKYTPYTWKL